MSTAAAKRRTTATERKESQGGPGRRWGGGTVTIRGTTVALGSGTQPGGGEHRQVEPCDGGPVC